MKDKIPKLKKTVYGTGDVLFGSVAIIVTFFVTVTCYNLYKIIGNLAIMHFNKVRSSKK